MLFAGYSNNIHVCYTLAVISLAFALVFVSFPYFAVHLTGTYVLTALWGFALLSIFTYSRGLNNPKAECIPPSKT